MCILTFANVEKVTQAKKDDSMWNSIVGMKKVKMALEVAEAKKKFKNIFSRMFTPPFAFRLLTSFFLFLFFSCQLTRCEDAEQKINCIMLHGAPGNGKTFIAKAFSLKTKSSFLSITCADILSKYHGSSEKYLATRDFSND